MKKANVELTERQWVLVQKAIEEGIHYVEQEALKLKRENKEPMTPAEKMELARGLIEKTLQKFKLEQYKPLIEPLIEAQLHRIFFYEDEPADVED